MVISFRLVIGQVGIMQSWRNRTENMFTANTAWAGFFWQSVTLFYVRPPPKKVLTTESAYLVQSSLSYKDSVVKVYQAYYYKSQ